MSNDNFMARAATSSAARRQQRQAEKAERAQADQRVVLPAKDWLLKEIGDEEQRLGTILLNLVNPDSSDDQLRAQLEAVRLHKKWLAELRVKVRNIVRPAEKEQERQSNA